MVLTVIGDDRSGLVDALATVVDEHGGNWTTSQMAQLAGKFAGIVMVTVPDQNLVAFSASLEPLEAQGLLDITIEQADPAPQAAGPKLVLELLGQDQPGIIAEVSGALADRNVSIIDLATETREAPMAGGTLFEARAVLQAPAETDLEGLKDAVEALAVELMIDITLSPDQG